MESDQCSSCSINMDGNDLHIWTETHEMNILENGNLESLFVTFVKYKTKAKIISQIMFFS